MNNTQSKTYAVAHVYKLYVPDHEEVYIGSSSIKPNQRVNLHNSRYNQASSKLLKEHGRICIEVLEEFQDISKDDLKKEEQKYMNQFQATLINKRRAVKPSKEEMKEYMKIYMRQDYKKNKTRYQEKYKQKLLKRCNDALYNRAKMPSEYIQIKNNIVFVADAENPRYEYMNPIKN